MTTSELSSAPVASGSSHLPWGVIGDLSGLVVAVALAADQVGPRRSSPFIYLLFGLGLITWLVLRQVQPRLPGLIRVGYIFVLAPPVAAALTLTVCAGLRDYYSRAAIALFVILWTGWVAIARYSFRRFAPRLRVLCVGDTLIASELSAQPRFQVERVRSPTMEFRTADLVVVGTNVVELEPWLRWLLHIEMSGVPILSAQRARESLTGRVPIDVLEEQWARGAFRQANGYLKWKRGLDVAAVVLAFPLILISCCLVGIAVLLESGRPILFTQLRVGRDGRPFRIYKFRTMRGDSEAQGAAFAVTRDPRVTRIGRWLRRTRLDELPQAWNVLRGDMSIIGPRPEQVGFAQSFDCDIPLYALRNSLRPGITGWAQVRQGYAAGPDESSVKVSYDLYYVKNCSIFLDLLILFHTFRIVVSGLGAR